MNCLVSIASARQASRLAQVFAEGITSPTHLSRQRLVSRCPESSYLPTGPLLPAPGVSKLTTGAVLACTTFPSLGDIYMFLRAGI